MRILIIEDEKKTSAFLQKGLSERGFFVEAAENGEDGLLSARAGNHDLIVTVSDGAGPRSGSGKGFGIGRR